MVVVRRFVAVAVALRFVAVAADGGGDERAIRRAAVEPSAAADSTIYSAFVLAIGHGYSDVKLQAQPDVRQM